jgi:hypothetical protein
MIKLASYHPICKTSKGRKAVQQFNIPPFADGSCRREPDFEASFPSISALCRVEKLAPTLSEGDHVVYLTVKNHYGSPTTHWKLTSILRVHKKFATHQDAATWYQNQDLPIPTNCMVESNPPKRIEETAGLPKFFPTLPDWDAEYRNRASLYPVFLACESLYCDLYHPKSMNEADMKQIIGTVNPGTQNPKILTPEQLTAFFDFAIESQD